MFLAAPWNTFSAADILRCVVRSPASGEPEVTLYCVVMGQTGMAYGVSFYEVSRVWAVVYIALCYGADCTVLLVLVLSTTLAVAVAQDAVDAVDATDVTSVTSVCPQRLLCVVFPAVLLSEPGCNAAHAAGQAPPCRLFAKVHSIRVVGG
jgi:hypothetical protein